MNMQAIDYNGTCTLSTLFATLISLQWSFDLNGEKYIPPKNGSQYSRLQNCIYLFYLDKITPVSRQTFEWICLHFLASKLTMKLCLCNYYIFWWPCITYRLKGFLSSRKGMERKEFHFAFLQGFAIAKKCNDLLVLHYIL